MEVENVQKEYLVKCYDITTRSGGTASFSLREDLGDSLEMVKSTIPGESDYWMHFNLPREKRMSRIRASEVSGVNYYEVKHKVMNPPIPKSRKFNASA